MSGVDAPLFDDAVAQHRVGEHDVDGCAVCAYLGLRYVAAAGATVPDDDARDDDDVEDDD